MAALAAFEVTSVFLLLKTGFVVSLKIVNFLGGERCPQSIEHG